MTNHPDDPVIAELRAIREAHAARFNHDMGEIFRDIRAMQEEVRQRVHSSSSTPDC